jgi:hypothetical protein
MRIRILVLALISALAVGCSQDEPGPTGEAPLRIRVVDAATGEPIPARIEVRTPDGAFAVPPDALLVTLECAFDPPSDWPEGVGTRGIENPHTGSTQFYIDGEIEVGVAPGPHEIRVERGIEWKLGRATVEVGENGAAIEIPLHRWANEPARGWWGADDHIHLTRRTGQDDARISAWMQAEDLHVANLLQMGTMQQHDVTPQPAFGPNGVVRSGNHLLVPGQEHPRTHFLGHTITLGANERIDSRDTYIHYESTWAPARAAGGVSGFAHWGAGVANDGLAIDAPRGWISFIEVLQFEWPYYAPWYDMLNLGIRVAPTAGTDFPCGPWSIPGRERFYARLDGDLSVGAWLDAISSGRTFVTNGPLVDFRVDGVDVGGDVLLGEGREVRVRGSVRFDPDRDRVDGADFVVNGRSIPLQGVLEPYGSGMSWRFDQLIPIESSSWVALRVEGRKPNDQPIRTLDSMGLPQWVLDLSSQIASGAQGFDEREEWIAERVNPVAAAHTAPIWITVVGTPRVGRGPEGRALAARYVERLDDFAEKLSDDHIADQPIWDWVTPFSDGVSEEHLRANRPAVLRSVEESRTLLQHQANGTTAGED